MVVFFYSLLCNRVVPHAVWKVRSVDIFAECLSDIENPTDIFDPSVFDIRMLLTVVAVVGLVTFIVYKWWLRRGKQDDTFFDDLGISFSSFEFPDEVYDYNALKVGA